MKTMKLLLLTGLLMVGVVCSLLAEGIYNDVVNFYAGNTDCNDTTATAIRPANSKRVGFSLYNPDDTYYAYLVPTITSPSSEGFAIPPGSTYWKDVNPYNGALYVITASGTIAISYEETGR